MDPKKVFGTLSKVVGVVKEGAGAAGGIANVVETVFDGKVRRAEKTADGKVTRAEKTVEIFEGVVKTCESVAKSVCDICDSQSKTKAENAQIYDNIKNKQKERELKLISAYKQFEIDAKKAEAEIKDMEMRNETARIKVSNEHEKEMGQLKLQGDETKNKHEESMQRERNHHEEEMYKIRIEEKKADAEIRNTDAKTDDIKEQTRKFREFFDLLIAYLKNELDFLINMQKNAEFSPENLEMINQHRLQIFNEFKALQQLTMQSEE